MLDKQGEINMEIIKITAIGFIALFSTAFLAYSTHQLVTRTQCHCLETEK